MAEKISSVVDDVGGQWILEGVRRKLDQKRPFPAAFDTCTGTRIPTAKSGKT